MLRLGHCSSLPTSDGKGFRKMAKSGRFGIATTPLSKRHRYQTRVEMSRSPESRDPAAASLPRSH